MLEGKERKGNGRMKSFVWIAKEEGREGHGEGRNWKDLEQNSHFFYFFPSDPFPFSFLLFLSFPLAYPKTMLMCCEVICHFRRL